MQLMSENSLLLHSGHEIDLANEQLTLEEVAVSIEKATGVKLRTRYLLEEGEVERAKALYTYGMWQWALTEDHFVTNPQDLEKYGIRLTTFDEFCEREAEGLKEVLVVQKKD
jgi:hypothetical protein